MTGLRSRKRRRRILGLVVAFAVLVTVVAACSADPDTVTPSSNNDADAAMAARVEELSESVRDWADAGNIEEAHVAAEAALNLVVGPNGPGYGDRNGDGSISSDTDEGILPGVDGTPAGFALPLSANPCVERDVLGGGWSAPEQRWAEMETAIEAWAPGNNTMPTLASHPMRVVGWATFTLESDSLELAHEYASHARLHVDITDQALDC